MAVRRKDKGMEVPKWLSVVFIILVLLIAFSRNYLGVHTPQDVVAALVIGAAVLFLMSKLMPIIDERPNMDIWVMLGGVALCALLILYAALKPYPTDYAADGSVIVEGSKMAVDSFKNAGMGIGFFIGWFIERRFIKFSTDDNTNNIIRLIFCILTYTVLDHFAGVGADEETIKQDYLLTNDSYKDLIAESEARASELNLTEDETKEFVGTAAAVYEDFFNIAIDSVKAEYGSVENYLTDGLGLTDDDITALRDKFLE